MARGTEEQEQASELDSAFPYKEYLTHPAWPIIEKAIADLESNGDLELQTAKRHVIGFLLKALADRGVLPPSFAGQFSEEEREHASWQLVFSVPPQRPVKRKLLTARK